MDERVEETTGRLKRERFADIPWFFGRGDFEFTFTKKSKSQHAPYSLDDPFTDSGSRQTRRYFVRDDYVVQNKENGCMPLRGIIPRIR